MSPEHCESELCARRLKPSSQIADGGCPCGCNPCDALNPGRGRWDAPLSEKPKSFPLLKAPFPWFGGKSRCASLVWQAFGNVPNFVEPFFGSGAVMLARPHTPKIETINDADCYVANFWRAVQHDPDAVAQYCDWPVNEADLHAWHRWLVGRADFREQMMADSEYFDARVAGWWVWGLSQWIGGGWCQIPTGTPSRVRKEHLRNGRVIRAEAHPHMQLRKPTHRPGGIETVVKLPNLSSQSGNGTGVHRKRPSFTEGQLPRGDVWLKRPVLGHGGRGVVSATRLPSLGNERGIHGAEVPPCTEWFRAIQERLRRVRVVCGDWTRVMGNSVLGTTKSRSSGMNPCGVFLDPPYSDGERDAHLYAVDDGAVAAKVAEWARTHGDDPDLRIALCGYEGEHVMPDTWTCVPWKARRGYAGADNGNRHRERIWFSPHCLPITDVQTSLFGVAL